ncbi:MAG: YifB family Mg chelatase-like AAA ATPase [Eubacterium sp.]|nr:YifB family Mg chelatase-like AAA ATPase [Eubacterium sp.]
MISKVFSAVIKGIEAVPVTIETDIGRGLPGFIITGLADATVKEAAVRVRAAIMNSGFRFPNGKISINIAPAGIRKRGSALDLGIAIGILTASGQILGSRLSRYIIAGELSLDGSVCPTPGILNIADEAAKCGRSAAVPAANLKEAAIIRGLEVYPVNNLREMADHLNLSYEIAPVTSADVENAGLEYTRNNDAVDFSDVKGQEQAKRALMIAAAGGHGVLMTGSPSTGKTMLAERIPGIMPPMSYKEIIKTTEVYSAAGLLSEEMPFINERPFRRPHHSVTEAGLIGGGNYPKPGEITLASSGILFLDELAEMDPKVVDALREPLERKTVSFIRGGETYTFPADFLFIAASNPCRCGYYGDPDHRCICSPGDIERYRQKISGPIMDRIDIHLDLRGVAYSDLEKKDGMSTAEMQEMVLRARSTQLNRFRDAGIELNSQMTDKMIKKYVRMETDGETLMKSAYESLKLSPRTMMRTIKVAQTISDLYGKECVGADEISEALQYSRYGKENGVK